MAHGLTEKEINDRILVLSTESRVNFTLLPPKAGWESDNPLLGFTKVQLKPKTIALYQSEMKRLIERDDDFARYFNRSLRDLDAAFIKSEVYHKDGKDFPQVGHIFGPKDHGRLKSTVVKRYWLYRQVVLLELLRAANRIQRFYRRMLLQQRARRLEDGLVVEVPEDPVDNWDTARVIQWLCNIAPVYNDYVETFEHEGLDGPTLKEYTHEAFLCMGVQEHHVLRLLREIDQLA